MYDLTVDGVAAFFQRRPSAQRLVRREPLVGSVDGYNSVFLVPHRPFLVSTLLLYAPSAPLTPVPPSYVDADGGVVILPSAPSERPTYDCTAVPITLAQTAAYVFAGFQLMEMNWSRGLQLSSSSLTFVPAQVTDPHQYVVQVNTNGTMQDPVCGPYTFATSLLQQAFLAQCIELSYLDAQMQESALGDLDISERVGGIRVNASKRATNLRDARVQLQETFLKAWRAAEDEYYPNGEHYIDGLRVQHTLEYEGIYHWQRQPNGVLYPLGTIMRTF